MKKIHFILFLFFSPFIVSGQLTSDDIRHASGQGPYPIYITVSPWTSIASTKNTVRKFTSVYSKGLDKKNMFGFEANVGFVINEENFLNIINLPIKRISLEAGYRHLYRNFREEEGDQKLLHIQEETIGIRIGWRGNLLYPLTYQVQMGPTIHNFVTAYEFNNGNNLERSSVGFGAFQEKSRRKFPSGWEFRGRLMFLDPAGTDGGIGIFFEYRYLFTFGGGQKNRKNIQPIFERFLEPDVFKSLNPDEFSNRWNYGSFSLGMVIPFAIRIT